MEWLGGSDAACLTVSCGVVGVGDAWCEEEAAATTTIKYKIALGQTSVRFKINAITL